MAAIGRLFTPTISRNAVRQWDQCPPERVLAIERATGGKVTRHQLRPDIYPLPEVDLQGADEVAA
jgi:DNA-binding transcriptional regulator YdaS (Cro superfamily)